MVKYVYQYIMYQPAHPVDVDVETVNIFNARYDDEEMAVGWIGRTATSIRGRGRGFFSDTEE